MTGVATPAGPGAPRWPGLIPIVLIGIPVALKLAGVPIGNAWIIFALLFGLMLTGMPISISLGLTVLTYLFTMTTVPIESVALKLFTGIEKFEIMAIPFFILAGNFLTHGGVARRMINFASAMVGHWHGGLALAGVMACALFAAVSGSSPATVVAIGSIILPAMVKQGFPKRFGAGVITTSGALGILIPPSIVMVMYAVATNTSVGALFIAGIIPGLVLATMLGLTTWWRARKNNYPRQPKATWGRRFRGRSRRLAAIWGPCSSSWCSGNAGAITRRRLSRISRNSRHAERSQRRESPGGKKTGLPFQSLNQQRGQQLGLHPSARRVRIVLRQLANPQQPYTRALLDAIPRLDRADRGGRPTPSARSLSAAVDCWPSTSPRANSRATTCATEPLTWGRGRLRSGN